MGASDWHYVVGYRDTIGDAFAELQRKVLSEGDYYKEFTFETFSDLEAARYDEDFWDVGTHSILDMMKVIEARERDETAAVRVLRDDEVVALFGTDRPTAADFERFLSTEWYVNRWEGRTTVLYDDGKPARLAFWGISGD